MKLPMLLIALACTMTCYAQKTWCSPLFEKNDWIVYSSQYLSGASDGIREQVLYHPIALFEQFPGLNRQWWDSRISWQNKDNESRLLVAFSDANHFFKGSSLMLNCTSIAFSFGDMSQYKKGEIWKEIAKKLVFSYLVNKAGFATSYYLTFKNK